jgi:hypothetical protein
MAAGNDWTQFYIFCDIPQSSSFDIITYTDNGMLVSCSNEEFDVVVQHQTVVGSTNRQSYNEPFMKWFLWSSEMP